MISSFRPPAAALDTYESPAARCLGILDRAMSRGSGCDRLINDFGGPEGVRAALLKNPKNHVPTKTREGDFRVWTPMVDIRRKWLAPLKTGDRLTIAQFGRGKDYWRQMVDPLIRLGFLESPEFGVVIRTSKPDLPAENGEVLAAIAATKQQSRQRVTPQAARQSYLREIQPGQTVARPDHLTPSEWMWAMSPLVRLGFLEAIGAGSDALSVVRRTDKPDMPLHTSTIRALADRGTKRKTNRNGRATT